MITFDEIKTLIGTQEGRVYYKLIDKIHSVEVARAIILLLIEQKCICVAKAKVFIAEPTIRRCFTTDLYVAEDERIETLLFDYDADDVLDAWDEENKNNDNEGN